MSPKIGLSLRVLVNMPILAATSWARTSPNCRSLMRQVFGSSVKYPSACVPSRTSCCSHTAMNPKLADAVMEVGAPVTCVRYKYPINVVTTYRTGGAQAVTRHGFSRKRLLRQKRGKTSAVDILAS